jgi:large subunit ribosomal protein L24
MKLHIKKGDLVKAIVGVDKGKDPAKVLTVDAKKQRAIVEGYNIVTKHLKPQVDQNNPDGGLVKTEASIHLSNLALVVGGEIVKTGRKLNDKGQLQRYSKKTGEFIK